MADRLDAAAANARARGLATRLFSRGDLEALAGPDLRTLASALARSGRLEPLAGASADDIEASAKRTAAKRVGVLARWGGGPALEVFFADQDRRTVRAMLRGAASGTPAEERAAGLLPSPLLPERAIVALAHEPTAARVAAHLVLLGFPGAARLVELATRAHPVLFELDLAVLRGFAERVRAAARAGDRNLRELAAWMLDTENVVTALTLAASPRDVDPAACFVEGGTLDPRVFCEATGAKSAIACAEEIARALSTAPLAKALRASDGDPARFERASRAACIEHEKRRARVEPLSSAPIVHFLLRVAAQSADLRRLAWGASLGAPATVVRAELETPWS